jgi:hypothetical protein
MTTATTTAALPVTARFAAAPQPAITAAGPPRSTSRATYWRRRATVLAGLLALVVVLVTLTGLGGAEADLEDRIAGQVTLAPGDTLWDVATEHAPAGVDTRAYLADIRQLNGFDSGALDPWTVVLLPRR